MRRRTYLLVAGGTVSTLLAGCMEQSQADDPADGEVNGTDTRTDATETPTDTSEQGQSDDELDVTDSASLETPEAAIRAYVAAANASDESAIANVMHSETPMNPANLEDVAFGFEPFDEVAPEDVTVTNVREDVPVEEIRDLQTAELWFEDVDLAAKTGSDTVTVVTTATGHAEIDNTADTWVLVRADGEWRVWFVSTDEAEDLNLADVREEELLDENEDVVADVTWDVEPYVDDFETDQPLVEVQFTESPDVEVETVRVETAVSGSNAELHNDSDGDAEVTWAGSRTAIEYDPDGDQLEVIAIEGDNETVVHREHYNP